MPLQAAPTIHEARMKRALLVGIDSYDQISPLHGCVNDVNALTPLIARNEGGSPNFDCRAQTSEKGTVNRRSLLVYVDELLKPGADVAFFYFAGHGQQVENDVVLVTQDGGPGDWGVSMSEVLAKVQNSPVPEVLIILDCCFSGVAGGVPQLGSAAATLRQGLSILTASRGDQVSWETSDGRGMFSKALCGALAGGAADVLGRVNIAGVYAYLTESFGPWEQRPTFKTNVDRLHELRLCSPAVPPADLRRLPDLFPTASSELPLDPSYEPTAYPPHPEHEADFLILQHCRSAKLLEPVGEQHLFYAAVNSKSCRLTPLGQLFWLMAKRGRL
jgi:hypothetical protein